MDERTIPMRVDNVVPILFWDPLEVSVAIAIFGFSFLVNLFLPGIVLVILFLKITRAMKRGAKRGTSQHAVWAFGANIDTALKKFPKSFENEFIS